MVETTQLTVFDWTGLKAALGDESVVWSMLGGNGSIRLRTLVEQIAGDRRDLNILEIGTCRGVSACILADYGNVDTVDVVVREPKPSAVIDYLKPRGRITTHIVKDVSETAKIAMSKVYDLAYVDGDHRYAGVKADYEACRAAGIKAIIFHDYHRIKHPSVYKFVAHEIAGAMTPVETLTVHPPFAMWRNAAK